MPSRPPNVILVLTDDQGYPPICANGHSFVQTPHLDRFHAEAVRFEQFHSGTTCAPTRAGLLTGHYCNSTGVWHTVGGRSLLRADEWTLADALGEAGWRTGVFGKWHLGDAYPYRPQDRGFQRSIVHGGGGVGQTPDWWGNDYFDDTYLVDGVPTPFDGYCTDVFFAEALKFIEASPDSPCFCFISTNAPHSPFNVPPQFQALYAGKTVTENYARFLAMITNIDQNFGALRARLASAGLEQNTILIFASDNGQCPLAVGAEPDAFNGGMRGLKGSMFEGGHRIPFFMRWPDGDVGQREVAVNAAYIDLMPTLLDLCAVETPSGRAFHGCSLAALARGASAGPEWAARVLVTDTQRVPRPIKWRLSCVMRGSWRLINGEALYDLATDPGQRRDVAAEHPRIVADLRDAYEVWWELCDRQADETIPIVVGEDAAAALLTSHDLRNDAGDGVWNQGQVRRGEACAGYWEVKVAARGRYEISLHRWPPETRRALRDGIEGADVAFRSDAIAEPDWQLYVGGTALPVEAGRVDIGEQTHVVAVADGQPSARLALTLEAGEMPLRAWFTGPGGLKQSPYYVQIRRIDGV